MKYQENVLENFIKSAMGNLKLKEFHITSNGEPIYHLVYKATNEIVTPLETLKGMKQLRDDIIEAIKEIEDGKTIKIKLRKYTYYLIREPAPTDKIAGCFGCFFCKRRDGNYIQTCGPYKLGSCGSIFKKNHTIFKFIKRECNETNRDDMGYVQGIP